MIAESIAASALLAFALGNRHGMDADHLAAIDGMTRWNADIRGPLAVLNGLLFSAGHVGVIFILCTAFFGASVQFAPPAWLEMAGTLISGGTLFLLGVFNLRAALSDTREGAAVGFRSRLMRPFLRASSPWQVALVGALFAISLDSVALAAFFATSKPALDDVLLVTACFAVGMLVVGGANGWWVVRLLRQSHRAGRQATRVMTLSIAFVSFLVSARVLMPLMFPESAAWFADSDWLVSIGVMTVVLTGFFVSGRIISQSKAQTTANGVSSCAV